MCMGTYVPLKFYLSISNHKDVKFFYTLNVCDLWLWNFTLSFVALKMW